MFYPLIPLIAQFFNIVGEIDYAFGHVNRFWMLYASYIGTSIQGFLITLLFFTIDPAVIELRRSQEEKVFREMLGDSPANICIRRLEEAIQEEKRVIEYNKRLIQEYETAMFAAQLHKRQLCVTGINDFHAPPKLSPYLDEDCILTETQNELISRCSRFTGFSN
ncbi:MAG: hypothetical protein SGCHY_001364, partial [Lobulomycetales sp.]